MAFLEEVCHSATTVVSIDLCHSQVILCLVFVDQDVICTLSAAPGTVPWLHHHGLSPLEL